MTSENSNRAASDRENIDAKSGSARLIDELSNDAPHRVQRKRTKGWRMPANTVSVCRPGKFGNPFKPAECRAAGYEGTDLQIKQRCVEAFRAWLFSKYGWMNWQGDEADKRKAEILDGIESLRGKNLACYCKLDEPCHADVLLEAANK